jgi:hypothetical protein
MSNKKKMINYTSRDFKSIKDDLEEHARRYFPDNYKDFSENSFGSYMIDAVSYVGDMLSFYLDYQANESFIQNSIEYDNVIKHAQSQGIDSSIIPPVSAITSFYVIVPAASTGLGPDFKYIPILKQGAIVRSDSGVSFVLSTDVDFGDSKNEVVAARFDSVTGKPTDYAIRGKGVVVSYMVIASDFAIGTFEKFKKIRVGPPTIFNIDSVVDSEGNIYYEVKHLAQDVVYIDTTNVSARADGVPSIIKRKIVPRRFVVSRDSSGTYIQFGSGDEEAISSQSIIEPSQVTLQFTGRNYITDTAFDPSELLGTKTLGVAPSNTTLTVTYANSTSDTINVATGGLKNMGEYRMDFVDRDSTSSAVIERSVTTSIETANSSVISGDVSQPTSNEIRTRVLSSKFTQMRAVTKEDYEALVYLMPAKFGTVKRATIINDPSSSNRRLSLYIMSSDSNGNLSKSNGTIKSNIKTWLETYKTLNDNIDIEDALIVNIGFDFKVIVDPTSDKSQVLNTIMSRLASEMSEKMHIGEPFYITNVFNTINKVDGVLDTTEVLPKLMVGTNYNTAPVSIEEMKSLDGTYLRAPRNVIFEIKDFNADIRGTAV